MATPNKPRTSEGKTVDLNRRAGDLQREIERLETTLGSFVAVYPYPQQILILDLT